MRDAVALLLAEAVGPARARRARGSPRAGRAAAGRRAGRCAPTPRPAPARPRRRVIAATRPSGQTMPGPERRKDAFTACSHLRHGLITNRNRGRANLCPTMDESGARRRRPPRRRAGDHARRGARARRRARAHAVGARVPAARRAGRHCGRDRLAARSCTARSGAELRAGDRSVDVYVSKLRTKLEAAMPDRRFIHTHPGFGYRFQTAAFTSFLTTGRAARVLRLVAARPSDGPAGHALAQRPKETTCTHARLAALGARRCSRWRSPPAAHRSSSSTTHGSSSSAARRTINARRLDVRRTRLPAVGLAAEQRHAQLPGRRLRARASPTLENKTVDFGGTDPPLKPADIAAISQERQRAAAAPDVLRRDHRLLQRPGRQDAA